MLRSDYILHLPKWYPNQEDELEGIFVQRHISASSTEYKHKVIFVKVSKLKKLDKPFQCHRISTDGMDEFYCYSRDSFTGFSAIDKFIKFILYYTLSYTLIKKCIKEFGLPKIIHVHVLLRSSILAYLFSKYYNIPYLITEHNTMYHGANRFRWFNIKNYLRKFIVGKASAVIVVSSNLARAMNAFGLSNNNYKVIYNSVNTNQFQFDDKEDSENFRFLHVSEFKDYHKNISGILKVFKTISVKKPHVYLDLVGYGEDLEMIKNLIIQLGLESKVELKGKLTGNELARQYQHSDFFVLFSNKENMPCVLAEALCCGLPVLSSNVGGISEIINESNGILVEASNEDQLFHAMMFCLDNKETFDRKAISESGFLLFGNSSVGAQIIGIYAEIT